MRNRAKIGALAAYLILLALVLFFQPGIPALVFGRNRGPEAIRECTAARLQSAREIASARVEEELEVLFAVLRSRIDESFIPYYFNYWRQQWWSVIAAGCSIRKGVVGAGLTAEEAIGLRVMDGFRKRVLEPAQAEERINRILTGALIEYLSLSQNHVSRVTEDYGFCRNQWDAHIRDMATIAQRANADRGVGAAQKLFPAIILSGIVIPRGAESAAGLALRQPLKTASSQAARGIAAKTAGGAGGKAVNRTLLKSSLEVVDTVLEDVNVRRY